MKNTQIFVFRTDDPDYVFVATSLDTIAREITNYADHISNGYILDTDKIAAYMKERAAHGYPYVLAGDEFNIDPDWGFSVVSTVLVK